MYGVVLWSDTRECKAVIWCEDHGDLAYYRRSDMAEQVALDAGDWVQFDVTRERHMRYAHNPRLVAEGVFDGLADSLKEQRAPQMRRVPSSVGIIRIVPAADRRHSGIRAAPVGAA